MTILEILNYIGCSLSTLLGTGLKACGFNLKTPRTIYLFTKGLKVSPSTEFDLDYIQSQQQQEDIIILQGVVDFVDNTPDNDRVTRAATGEMRTTLKHPYLWTFTFDNGINFHKALVLLSGNDRYDIGFSDDTGNFLGAKDKDGSFRGLDMGMLDTGKYVAGNENSQSITIQIDRNDFDTNAAWIDAESLTFNPKRDLDGWNDVNITLNPLAVGATTITWKAFLVDGSHPFSGTVVGNYLLQKTVSGVTTTVAMTGPITYDTNTQNFSATIPAAVAGIYGLKTNDTTPTPDTAIVIVAGVLYRGLEATVVAA